jgi:hypothetical protein
VIREYTVSSALENVALHLEVAVLGAQLHVLSEHHLDVLLLLGERPWGAARRRHRRSRRREGVGQLGFGMRGARRRNKEVAARWSGEGSEPGGLYLWAYWAAKTLGHGLCEHNSFWKGYAAAGRAAVRTRDCRRAGSAHLRLHLSSW